MRRQQPVFHDDDLVGIILDTYGDYQRAYEFAVNPYGVQADLMRVEGNEDESLQFPARQYFLKLQYLPRSQGHH